MELCLNFSTKYQVPKYKAPLFRVSACITIASLSHNLRFVVLHKSSGGTQDFLNDISQGRF